MVKWKYDKTVKKEKRSGKGQKESKAISALLFKWGQYMKKSCSFSEITLF